MAVLPCNTVTWYIALTAASSICDGMQQAVTYLLASYYSSAQELRAASRGAGTVAGCILFSCGHYTQL